MSPENVWATVLETIKPQIPLQSFNTWFKSTRGVSIDDRIMRVAVANRFVLDWIQGRYRNIIEEAICSITGSRRELEFAVQENCHGTIRGDSLSPSPSRSKFVSTNSDRGYWNSELNKRYSFESFVVGDSNRFAHAASMAVAENPLQTKYNPLYVYGGVGLGKTHLVQALGNQVCHGFSNLKVLYATSEKFTNDFIEAIARSKTSDFAKYYRNVDLLLLDDIQFLAGKEATQEQFFHTFNALYQAGKQIVLTSDRSPREINGLEERLLSRFQCGLVTDIQPPDLETRIAILNQKVESERLSIPTDVISYLANNITRNIRELEGSILRLLAYRSLTGKEINTMVAYDVLKNAFTTERTMTVERITECVCEYFRIPTEQLKSRRKTAELVRARQIAMHLSRKHTSMSLKEIGLSFGGRDHSTVIHAINAVADGLQLDISLRNDVNSIDDRLRA